MGFSSVNGYIPVDIPTIMADLMAGVNAQFGTSYTTDTFVGTNFYKFMYSIAQRIQKNEVKASEVFAFLQQYFAEINAQISHPVATNPGMVDAFKNQLGFIASLKQIDSGDAGKLYVAVDLDNTDPNYAVNRLAANTLIKDSMAAGVVPQGSEVDTITLSNGQDFDFKFNLPNSTDIWVKLSIKISENTQVVIPSDDDIKAALLLNISQRYRLGLDFEPQRYFNQSDALYAASILLEYSTDGGSTYVSTIFNANYDDVYRTDISRTLLVFL